MPNLALDFAVRQCGSVEAARQQYDGLCIDFAGDLADHIGGRLAYFDGPPNCWKWKYHAVCVKDGMVYDLWQDEALPLEFYCKLMGCEPDYPAEEHDNLR